MNWTRIRSPAPDRGWGTGWSASPACCTARHSHGRESSRRSRHQSRRRHGAVCRRPGAGQRDAPHCAGGVRGRDGAKRRREDDAAAGDRGDPAAPGGGRARGRGGNGGRARSGDTGPAGAGASGRRGAAGGGTARRIHRGRSGLDGPHTVPAAPGTDRRDRPAVLPGGLTLVAALHDLNLAAMYCRTLVLLERGRIAALGAPEEVLTPEALRRVYGATVLGRAHPLTGRPHVTGVGREGAPAGGGSPAT